MARPIQDQSLQIKPCPFYAGPDSGTFPKIAQDSFDQEQPCSPGQIRDEIIPETLALGFVATAVCARQRKYGVCPRDLGENVPLNLIPLNQRR